MTFLDLLNLEQGSLTFSGWRMLCESDQWSLSPKALCMNAGALRPHECHHKSSKGPCMYRRSFG